MSLLAIFLLKHYFLMVMASIYAMHSHVITDFYSIFFNSLKDSTHYSTHGLFYDAKILAIQLNLIKNVLLISCFKESTILWLSIQKYNNFIVSN